MKAICTVICMVLIAGLLTSCEKTYECVCISKYDDGTINQNVFPMAIFTQAKSKKEANATCNNRDTSIVAANGQTLTTTCKAVR